MVVKISKWLAEDEWSTLALSSAKASQNALWVTKLSFLKIIKELLETITELQIPQGREIKIH